MRRFLHSLGKGMGETTFEALKEKALSLPLKPGVYLMMDREGTVIYVGKAKALKNRVSQYFHDQAGHTEKTRAMVAQIDHFDTIVAGSEFEALVLENSLIKRHKPRYNILLKDDKGYPYIRLSVRAPYPKFSIQGRMADDGARYFGPFGGRHDTQAILDALRAALKLPSCGKTFPRDQGKERPCLNFHMGQCDGYCRKEVPRSQHDQAIDQAIHLLEGKFSEVEKDLRTQMEAAAENLEFEKAAALRDRLRAITLLGKRQKVVAGFLADTDVLGLYVGTVRSVVAVLHFQGGELAGRDLEVFPTAGEPVEEILSAFLVQYYSPRGILPRQILLPENLEGDGDFAHRPDLLLIDGGATHAAVASRVLAQYGLSIPVFGMVKDDRHRTRALVTPEGEEIGIQGAPALFAFIGQIQEETHRSAVGFHHKRHTKSGLGSTLEKIPGIGETRRKKLLKAFGSVKAIRQADLSALEEVLPRQAALSVYQYFRTNEEEGTCASSQGSPGAGG